MLVKSFESSDLLSLAVDYKKYNEIVLLVDSDIYMMLMIFTQWYAPLVCKLIESSIYDEKILGNKDIILQARKKCLLLSNEEQTFI